MNSQATLTNHSATNTPKGQVRLLYKRSDPHNAVLEQDAVPYFFLTTSDDGVRNIRMCDAAQRVVVEVHRKTLFPNAIVLADRNGGKTMKVDRILKKGPCTSDGQMCMIMHTEQGVYYWRKKRGHHWALYMDSSDTPVSWIESVPGSAPTWVLVLESQVSSILDYVLASLFYLKGEPDAIDGGGKEWEGVDGRTAWMTIK